MSEAPGSSEGLRSAKRTFAVVATTAFLAGAAGVVLTKKLALEEPVLVRSDALLESDPRADRAARDAARLALVAANESDAVAQLRSIAEAQQMLQVSCAIDTDGDGTGEFGYFAELAGTAPMRVRDPETGMAALGTDPEDLLDPPFLLSVFGQVAPDQTRGGVVEHGGYCFKIYLPDETIGGVTPGRPEDPRGGASPGDVGSDHWASANCEVLWCAYAWPVEVGETGVRVFMVNQEGEVVQFDNPNATYEGLEMPPRFDAVYHDAVPRSMDQALGLKSSGRVANDGNLWTIVRG